MKAKKLSLAMGAVAALAAITIFIVWRWHLDARLLHGELKAAASLISEDLPKPKQEAGQRHINLGFASFIGDASAILRDRSSPHVFAVYYRSPSVQVVFMAPRDPRTHARMNHFPQNPTPRWEPAYRQVCLSVLTAEELYRKLSREGTLPFWKEMTLSPQAFREYLLRMYLKGWRFQGSRDIAVFESEAVNGMLSVSRRGRRKGQAVIEAKDGSLTIALMVFLPEVGTIPNDLLRLLWTFRFETATVPQLSDLKFMCQAHGIKSDWDGRLDSPNNTSEHIP
jgi:hypothetical protein